MAGLLIVGVVAAAIALYLADRFLKARAQARRLREINDRLTAAAARVDEQQAQKQAQARASAALTNVMPAINRPPLSLPGVPARGPARARPSCERPAPAEHGTHSPAAGRPGRRAARTGDHGPRPSERHGA